MSEPQPPPPPVPAEFAEGQRDGKGHVDALKSRACPKCGGKAVWNPRRQALTCPYCEYVLDARNPAADEEAVISEHDLHEALRTLEEASKGREDGMRKVHCQNCNADSLQPLDRVADRCQFCGSPSVIAYDTIENAIKPESLLPKKIDKNRAYAILKKWVGKRFWAPGDLKRRNMVEDMKGIYLPYWTFDAFANCPWSADSGTYYWETEHYTDGQGKRRTRRVRKTRWTPASGEVRHAFDDMTIPATQLLPREELDAIEPFPTGDLVPYDTVYVSGWAVEHYNITLLEGAKQARAGMQAVLRSLAGQDVPGDTFRNLRIRPEYSNETFKHILVPVWMLGYQYRRKIFRTVINGYTGAITGKYPKSGWKIFFAVLLGIIVAAAIILVVSQSR